MGLLWELSDNNCKMLTIIILQMVAMIIFSLALDLIILINR